MRAPHVTSVIGILLIVLGAAPCGWSHEAKQDASAAAPTARASVGAYPESADGLKKLVEDIFGVVESKDEARISSCVSALAIPDHGAWFVQTFGPTEGARLEAKYSELLPDAAKGIRKDFENTLKGKRTDVSVTVLQKPGEVGGLGRAILDSMVRPISVYTVDGNNPKEKFGYHIGDFVYVDGGFRYLSSQVWQELSTAPPMRIRLGGNVARANLINRVDPICYTDRQPKGRRYVTPMASGDSPGRAIRDAKSPLRKAGATNFLQRLKPGLWRGRCVGAGPSNVRDGLHLVAYAILRGRLGLGLLCNDCSLGDR
jgi:hypothetical protein